MKTRTVIHRTLLFCCLYWATGVAQPIQLSIISDTGCMNMPAIKKKCNSILEADKLILDHWQELYKQGFATAYTRSIDIDSNSVSCYFTCGSKYLLRISSVHTAEGANVLTNQLPFNNRPVALSAENLTYATSKVLSYYEDNGYPFASCQFEPTQFSDNTLHTIITVQAGPYIRIDSITLYGNAPLRPSCLYAITGVRPGDPYAANKLMKITQRLDQMDFINTIATPFVRFQNPYAFVSIQAIKKQSGEFDGLIGIQPNHYNSQKLLLTGELSLLLINTFEHAEEFKLQWQHKDALTQQLKASVVYPYIFGSPLAPTYSLDIYKKDSAYTTTTQHMKLQYRLSGRNHVHVFAKTSRTNVLQQLQSQSGLYNVSTTAFGTGVYIKERRKRRSHTYGLTLDISGSAGIKKILDDSIRIDNSMMQPKKETSAYELNSFISYLYPFSMRHMAYASCRSRLTENELLSIDDMEKIGGLRTLRGFDEEQFRAANYAVLSIEYRFMIEQFSYVLLFADHAFMKQEAGTSLLHAQATGVGAGLVFDTKAGRFSIYYGIGSQPNEPAQLRNAKIHIGYINNF